MFLFFFFRFLPWRFLLSSILLHEVQQMWIFHKRVQLLALLVTLLGCFFFYPSPRNKKWDVWHQSTVFASYGWWTKSCTTKDDEYPIIYRVLTIPGGAGFCPSTVCLLGSRCCWPSEPFRQKGTARSGRKVFTESTIETRSVPAGMSMLLSN